MRWSVVAAITCTGSLASAPAHALGAVLAGPLAKGPLATTNGNKVVVGRGRSLHGVFVMAGAIVYVTSTDGITWTTPVVVSRSAAAPTHPTLAEDSYGNLGVAYVANPSATGWGAIEYTYLTYPSGSWSTPVHVASGDFPSLAGYRGKMHLTWRGGDIAYTSFATGSPPAAGAFWPTPVSLTPLCGQISRQGPPSVAVARRDVCDALPPIVRVAHFEGHDLTTVFPGNSCGTGVSAGMRVKELDAAANRFTQVFTDSMYGSISTPFAAGTTSLAVNRGLGEFAAAYSYSFGANWVTKLARGYGMGTWNSASLLANQLGTVHVAESQSICQSSFRVSVTPLSSASAYGTTSFHDGTWPAAASAPTWLGSATTTTNGADATSVLWDKYFPSSGSTRFFQQLFESNSSGAPAASSLEQWYTEQPGNSGTTALPLCGFAPCATPALNRTLTLVGVVPWDPQIGSTRFELRIDNDGTLPFDPVVSLDAALVDGVTVVAAGGTGWSCEIVSERLACLYEGAPPLPGESIPFTIDAVVPPSAGPESSFCLTAEPVEDDEPYDSTICLPN